QRARTAQQRIRERLVGVGAGDGNAALRHGGRTAGVRAAEQSHAEGRAEGERRPHARLARETAEALDVVTARGRVPGAGVRVHEPPTGGEPRPHERGPALHGRGEDRKSTRLNSSHVSISYAVFCLKKKKKKTK